VIREPRQEDSMFQGLRTVGYFVEDIAEAKAWYAGVLGIEPYFDEPFYVGFNVGGYELGLMPVERGQAPDAGRVVAYWGVPDADAALAHLLDQGAQPNEAVQDVGGGVRVATVRDPFGNVFGIIENPNFELPGDDSTPDDDE
jgi:predicted enzyme related to lactoylglutathione lyase